MKKCVSESKTYAKYETLFCCCEGGAKRNFVVTKSHWHKPMAFYCYSIEVKVRDAEGYVVLNF